MRNRCYDLRLFKSRRVGVPVISVGNITVGGTGKTPVVEYLIRRLHPTVSRIAVVTRGYKRRSRGLVVVSDGAGMIADPSIAGDEPLQIARKFPTVVVIADANRIRGCTRAIDQFKCDVILLDDAYQHRACARNLDVVVIDATMPIWTERLIPSGRLREPLTNLQRADIILLSKCEPTNRYIQYAQTLSAYVSAPVLVTQFVPTSLVTLFDDRAVACQSIQGRTAFSCIGIGSPQSFAQTRASLGVHSVGERIFPDHHWYSSLDVYAVLNAFRLSKAEVLLTTEKDAMRLLPFQQLLQDVPVMYPRMEVSFLDNEPEFLSLLSQRISKRHS